VDLQLLAGVDIPDRIHGVDIGDLHLSCKNDPNLLARRVKTTEKEKSQKIIRFLVNLTFTAVIVVSVLGHRFGWSTVSSYVVVAGDILVTLGLLIIFFVFKENTLPPRRLK
jgi:protein-S-isoprenylcysteine O-methyltransferase Ste14